AETLHKNPDSFQVRVEHLLICELDSQELKTEDDCVTKLKELDGKSRLWPQEMILEIKGAYVVLCDIETKAELDSIPLRSIVKTRAVLESCAYNSLLVVTVQEGRRRGSQVFMFQCEETGAEIIKADLDKAIQRGGSDMEPRRMTPDIRYATEQTSHLRESTTGFRRERFSPVQQEENLPPPDYVAPQWDNRQPGTVKASWVHIFCSLRSCFHSFPQDIFNHILTDVEIFGDRIAEVMNKAPEKENKGKMMKFPKKKKSKSKGNNRQR
uniref:PTB domain-containing protein n=1 Tax=Poecilia latipinna TaxID=48699 RepID=A0A3B3TMS9_9TELE